MVIDQKHSSNSMTSEKKVIRHTKKLAKLLELDEQMLWDRLQNKVNSMLSSDDYLKRTVNELLVIGKCNCSKKYVNTSSEPSSSESSDSNIDEILNIIKHKWILKKIWEHQVRRRDLEENAYSSPHRLSLPQD